MALRLKSSLGKKMKKQSKRTLRTRKEESRELKNLIEFLNVHQPFSTSSPMNNFMDLDNFSIATQLTAVEFRIFSQVQVEMRVR